MKNLEPAQYLQSPGNYLLIDVRSDMEWDAAHDDSAVHIPLTELLEKVAPLPKDKPLALICRTGGRSLRACQMLESSGRNLFNVVGGMRGLVEAKKNKGIISEQEFEQMMAKL